MLNSKMSFVLGAVVPVLAFCMSKLRLPSHKPEPEKPKPVSLPARSHKRAAAPAGPTGGVEVSNLGESILEGMKSMYLVGWKEAAQNAYHAETNPEGCIQLGLAENMLSFDVVEDWYSARLGRQQGRGDAQLEDGSEATNEGLPLVALQAADVFGRGTLSEIGGYQDYSGLKEFREALAVWMGVVYEGRVSFDADKLITVGGCTAAVEILTFCIADAGDAILIPAPFYPGFVRDVEWRTGVKLVTADCGPDVGFAITYRALDHGLQDAEASGRRVRAILLSSPSNPVGITYDAETLREVVRFARDRNLHVICDEIFAGCVFSAPAFVSILEVLEEEDKERVHVVYGLSKDLGVAGFRVGSMYIHNVKLRAAVSGLSRFVAIASSTQKLLVPLLRDSAFAKSYLATHRERLRAKQALVSQYLDRAAAYGLEYVNGNAGVYVWIDMSSLLRGEEEERERVKAEEFLFLQLLYEAGININAGSTCGMKKEKDHGWFRLCFSAVGDSDLRVAMERLIDFTARFGIRAQ